MTYPALLEELLNSGAIAEIDFYFGRLLGEKAKSAAFETALAAALVSRSRNEGHTCLDLGAWGGTTFRLSERPPLMLPEPYPWRDALLQSGVVSGPDGTAPLILSNFRLYLRRYWEYERRLIAAVKTMTTTKVTIPFERLRWALSLMFPEQVQGDPHGQILAAFAATRRRLCIVTGAPGTGKTHTVIRILAVLALCYPQTCRRIVMAAPTGKAADRLRKAVSEKWGDLPLPSDVAAVIPRETFTLHRLLGAVPHSSRPRFRADNPLRADVVVIDEASMVDLALFSRLVQALEMNTHLIVLGDKDQLASVEAGAVLGDLCNTGGDLSHSETFRRDFRMVTGREIPGAASEGPGVELGDCIVELTENYRFPGSGGIAQASRLINEGQGEEALRLMRGKTWEDVAWEDLPTPEGLGAAMEPWVIDHYGPLVKMRNPEEALVALEGGRILGVFREGPFGVRRLNSLVAEILYRRGLLRPTFPPWYHGRPVMITENDYTLGLFNGNLGLAIMGEHHGGKLRVFFPGEADTLRSFLPLGLPRHETAYAITVHKSQGSEFDDVLIILPDEDHPLLTRELIYTALTRAKKRCLILGRAQVFCEAVAKRIRRASGLREGLWGCR